MQSNGRTNQNKTQFYISIIDQSFLQSLLKRIHVCSTLDFINCPEVIRQGQHKPIAYQVWSSPANNNRKDSHYLKVMNNLHNCKAQKWIESQT